MSTSRSKGNYLFGVLPFLLITLVFYLIITIFSNPILRAFLVYSSVFIFFLAAVFSFKKLKLRVLGIFATLFFICIYKLIQFFYVDDDFHLIVNEMLMLFALFSVIFYASNIDSISYLKNYNIRFFLILIIVFSFFISYKDWSLTRISGIFSNPNLTAHTAVVLFPFVLLFLNKRHVFFIFLLLVLLLVLTASRSAILALMCMSIAYFILYRYRVLGFFKVFLLVIALTLFSWFAVDLLSSFMEDFSAYFVSESRVFYTGYNGREILKQIGWDRFLSNPYFGVGSSLSKVYVDGQVLGMHNSFLDLLLRYGVFGTLLLAFLFLQILSIACDQNNGYRVASIVSLVGILSLATNSSVFLVLNYYFFWSLVLVFYGYNSSSLNVKKKANGL